MSEEKMFFADTEAEQICEKADSMTVKLLKEEVGKRPFSKEEMSFLQIGYAKFRVKCYGCFFPLTFSEWLMRKDLY